MYLDWTVFGRNFHYFLKCAQLKNISQASKVLGLTQASLSLAIKNLENEIGEPLFIRQPRGISLTTVGEDLYFILNGQGLEFERKLKLALGKVTLENIKVGMTEAHFDHFVSLSQKLKSPAMHIFLKSNKICYRAVEDKILDFALINLPSDPLGSLKFIKLNSLDIKVLGLKSQFSSLKKIKKFDDFQTFPWVTTETPLSHWSESLNATQLGYLVRNEAEVKKIILKGYAIGETIVDIFSKKEQQLLTISPLTSRFPSAYVYLVYPADLREDKMNVLDLISKELKKKGTL